MGLWFLLVCAVSPCGYCDDDIRSIGDGFDDRKIGLCFYWQWPSSFEDGRQMRGLDNDDGGVVVCLGTR